VIGRVIGLRLLEKEACGGVPHRIDDGPEPAMQQYLFFARLILFSIFGRAGLNSNKTLGR
jgi:hypothetical protein